MDKISQLKGATKNIKYEKQVLLYPHCHSEDKDKHVFNVAENDFPSLSEVYEKNPKPKNQLSLGGESPLSYSSKLKKLNVESRNINFENVQHSSHLSKNVSTLNKAASGRHFIKPSSVVQSEQLSYTNQSSSTVHNIRPSYDKRLTDSKLNLNCTEVKSQKSEYNKEHAKIKPHYGQKSPSCNKSVNGDSNTFEKNKHFPKNSNNLHDQKSPVNKGSVSSKNMNSKYSSTLGSEMFYGTERERFNISTQHKNHFEVNKSAGGSKSQGVRSLKMNSMQSNTSQNTSNKTRTAASLSSQLTNNYVKHENNMVGNSSLNVQAKTTDTSETKKKKKRKSKLKRQAALQTGKILVLTPEVHSKILSQSNNISVHKNQNILTNINDDEEYPELGSEAKITKESQAIKMHSKEENSTNLTLPESEVDNNKSLLVSKDSLPNESLKAIIKSEQRNIGLSEKSDGEKSTIHSKNPINLSLFDMLVTAKPRKKESEKKDESIEETNSGKVFKKEMTKKNVLQAVNPLASSKLTIKRGKEREQPKIKRPSRMRKLILMERQLKKEFMAMKKTETEDTIKDENQENSEEMFPRMHPSNDINESSTTDELETCVEIFHNNLSDSDDNYDILDCEISDKQFVLDSEDASLHSVPKIHTGSSLKSNHLNEIMNVHSVENQVTNVDDNEDEFASNLTDKVENSVEDIHTVENSFEISGSNIKNLNKEHSNLKNKINDTCSRDGNILEKTEDDCQTYNFANRMQKSEHEVLEKIEISIVTPTDGNIIANSEIVSEKKIDSSEMKQLSEIPDSMEKISTNFLARSFSNEERLKATKLLLHSRKFRMYCNHFISKEIDQAVFSLIDDLARFQDRMYQKDPVKAKIRRRLVYGIKEIKKHMKLKKIKCIIIATDIEDIKIEGGLNDSLRELISLAEAYRIPCVFSHLRFSLGKVCRKSVPVSCVGIFNYEGSEKNFKKMIELHEDSLHDYLAVTKKLAIELTYDQLQDLFEAEKESVLFLREVSQKVLREMVYFTPEGYRTDSTAVLPLQPEELAPDTEVKKCSEELTKLNIEEDLLKPNETGINTILVKYKVVKEC